MVTIYNKDLKLENPPSDRELKSYYGSKFMLSKPSQQHKQNRSIDTLNGEPATRLVTKASRTSIDAPPDVY